jgi:hypothetical protein
VASVLASANASKKRRKKRAMTEATCEYCGELSTECESVEECSYNKEDIGADEDALYENYKDQMAADYFDSKE